MKKLTNNLSFKTVLCFVLSIFSLSTFAGWEQKTLNFVAKSDMRPSDVLSNTCKNVVDAVGMLINEPESKQLKLTQIPLSNQVFFKRDPEILKNLKSKDYIHAFTHFSKIKNIRNLAIILPGIFQSFDHGLPKILAKKLISLGYHVVTFPSPFSDYYLGRYSTFNTGNYIDEMKIYYDAIKSIKRIYGDKFDKIHLVGASYGTFMSSLILAHDKDNLINGMTTLFSPQESMLTGLTYLDQYSFNSNFNNAPGVCSDLIGDVFTTDIQKFTLNLIRRYHFHKVNSNPRFYQYITDRSTIHYEIALDILGDEINNPKLIDNLNEQSSLIKAFFKSMGFWDTVKKYIPESLHYYENDTDSITYWLKKVKENKSHTFRVFITEDDFTSPISEWLDSDEDTLWLINSSQTIIRKNGSHLGYATEKWFDQFLESAFELDNYKIVCNETRRNKRCERQWVNKTTN